MPCLGPGETAGEVLDAAGADQAVHGGMPAGRHGPVIAGCAAAPNPPPWVLASEPLEVGVLVVPAVAGVHGGRQRAGAAGGAA
jgi:hypothetical protein